MDETKLLREQAARIRELEDVLRRIQSVIDSDPDCNCGEWAVIRIAELLDTVEFDTIHDAIHDAGWC